jgi:hypothetical protein
MLRYEQAEVVEHELQHMTEQVKSIIQSMNATQVSQESNILMDLLFSLKQSLTNLV